LLLRAVCSIFGISLLGLLEILAFVAAAKKD
jgi:hypothetical protein